MGIQRSIWRNACNFVLGFLLAVGLSSFDLSFGDNVWAVVVTPQQLNAATTQLWREARLPLSESPASAIASLEATSARAQRDTLAKEVAQVSGQGSQSIIAGLNQGQTFYNAGNLTRAAEVLQQTLQIARTQQNALGESAILSNLALVYGQQGRWTESEQAISSSLDILRNRLVTDTPQRLSVLAQTLNVQGRLQFGQGKTSEAFDTWQAAATVYRQAGDFSGVVYSQLKQARALQAQGFHQRALSEVLYPLYEDLYSSENSLAKVAALNSLAEVFQVIEGGQFAQNLATTLEEQSRTLLPETADDIAQASLEVAEALGNGDAISATQLTLGNLAFIRLQTAFDQGRIPEATAIDSAIEHYQNAIDDQAETANTVRAQLNQLNLLTTVYQQLAASVPLRAEEAQTRAAQAIEIWQALRSKLDDPNQFPLNQEGIYAQSNLARHLFTLVDAQPAATPSWQQIENILKTAQSAAAQIGDKRTTAYVFETIGALKQAQGHTQAAIAETEKALQIAVEVNAADITYRAYEQLGQLHEAEAKAAASAPAKRTAKRNAIGAYRGAIQTLKGLRTDLVNLNPELLFSFQESVEPVHRKLISLLLEENPSPQSLEAARDVIESLRIEEINDFLRAACVNGRAVAINEIANTENVAILYPIILENRLATIASFPRTNSIDPSNSASEQPASNSGQKEKLQYYKANVDVDDLKTLTDEIVTQTLTGDGDVYDLLQELHDLLLPPVLQAELEKDDTDTLVFVLDGFLRNLSMATLYDGEHFLIEKYAVALTPGFRLLNPEPIQDKSLSVLSFGLTEKRGNFSALPAVEDEIKAIEALVPTQSFLDDRFTSQQLEQSLRQSSRPIVHLATHGKFSSELETTYILAEDREIKVNELSQWLRAGRDRSNPIELLVLSACETAVSTENERAPLGLAGIAVRSGARSTIASLWQVNDTSTAEVMKDLYTELVHGTVSKAKALQNAQKKYIETHPTDDHPYYWGAFILVGNWL